MRSDPRFIGMFFGTIQKVYKPSDSKNVNKHQYEYDVVITMEPYCQIPVRCIKNDPSCGSSVNFEDEILDTGQRVFVEFPLADRTMGVIVGGSRSLFLGTVEEDIKWIKCFNLFEQKVDKDGVWEVKSYLDPLKVTVGGNISINKQKVRIGDNKTLSALEDYIEFDGASGKITIKAGTWEVSVLQSANITVIGDVSIKCKNANVVSTGTVDVKAQTVNVTALKEINLKSASAVNIDSASISMNKGLGQVITTLSQPTCYVTGLPFMGSTTVKAG
jgi:hypothetical protein